LSFFSVILQKQNLRGNIFPQQVKLKTGQREKEFCKTCFQYFLPTKKVNLTLFTSMEILNENLNY